MTLLQQSPLSIVTKIGSDSFTVSAFTINNFRHDLHGHYEHLKMLDYQQQQQRYSSRSRHLRLHEVPPSTLVLLKTREETKSLLTLLAAPAAGNEDLETSVSSSPSVMIDDAEEDEPHSQAWKDAMALKKRAERERLEADRMATALLLDKIASLEKQLEKLNGQKKEDVVVKEEKIIQKKEEIHQQIAMLRRQLELPSTTTPAGSMKSESGNKENLSFVSRDDIGPMPADLKKKRIKAYLSFTPVVQSLFARAAGVEDTTNAEKIIEECYVVEKQRIMDGNEAPMDILDIANAQAGYETLPPPIQIMIKESLDMTSCRNNTEIMEALILRNKVKRTDDGGVEFSMDDPDLDNSGDVESSSGSSKRGKLREFTQKEKDEALTLYESLPSAMKNMLAQSVGEVNENNSTMIVARLIEEKKLLPAEDGVEFVVFGNSDDTIQKIQGSGYIKGMLPEVTRKDGKGPTEEDAMVFFKEVLGKKTFNPTNKPERIPGGFLIRGQNTFDNGEDLIKALDSKLKVSSVADKLYYYYIKDPSLVTEQQFEQGDFENPVIIITGNDLSPSTNPFVKPIVTAFGGLSIASFAVAVCLATDMKMDIDLLESMASPLVFSVLGTQLAHEAMHQLVALKDKFKAGGPTIVPSLQLGSFGCITPIKSPPPNSNSLFDFAISGPLVGMIISLILMYVGLEKQAFMDPSLQANLPSLPVNLLRSSGLAGGMVEWLLGDGTLSSKLGNDSTALIKLHPYTIAGFIGIMTNALNLLPVGNTDGGRIAQAMFGRSFSKFIRGVTLILMVVAGFFGGDQANILLFFAIFAQIWQKEPEVPCKNEIDGISDERAVLAFATAFLVGLAVVPLSI
eukprot:CAMPEP_0176489474 /NCGR_PEP_ID=MMETSP0200_2-20121128/7308_1 /TAXON_ID=947934 /ORGANISM="Chaetoceros sp., Strain GSL56" /LENGTH=850 /DNA_ID=CAMNT_0017886619 /DNA_START=116 /DNA_END=2668 /DNA_ORIENTATION=+